MIDWKLGSDPVEQHPLWERQVELELSMVERGADRYRDRVAKAVDKEEMTSLRPYRRILEDMVDVMGAGVKSWLSGNARAKSKGLAYGRLKEMDPYVVAFITARTVLDGVSLGESGNAHLRSIAGVIGQAVMDEARMASWIERDPGLFKKVGRELRNQKATAQHRKRVNINRFNKLIKTKHRWHDWTRDERLHTGLKLIDILVRTTGHLAVVPDPTFIRRSAKKSAPYVIQASDELMQYLMDSVARDETRFPLYLPTLMPPKRWEGVRAGGYYTPLVRLPRLIRFGADNEEVQGRAADEYDSLDMPEVFAALDKVQEVPWRVNKRVLAVATEAWDRNIGIGKLKKREPGKMGANGKMVPEFMPDPEPGQRREDLQGQARKEAEAEWRKHNPKKFQQWKRKAATVYGDFARSMSNVMSTSTTLRIAEQFLNDEFYFPHMLDFRGRMYPIPAYLQPQGNDLARGLLTFACGSPVGERGAWWLGVHLANCWGNDKVSFDERYDWVIENWEMWTRIYQNPMGNMEWTQVDDPWQTLAAIFEFVRVASSDNPAGEVSSLPIRVDGTCNGIQHLSALMRDRVGAASVNLLPSDEPRDIYAEVAAILQAKLEGIRDAGGDGGQMAEKWLKAFGGTIPRKFTKSPVMVTPYGGTKDSFKGSVMQWLKDTNPKAIPDKKGVKYNARFEAAIWIVPHLWDSVAERVGEGKKCMEWLKDCARLVAEAEQPIWWSTTTGFQVRHFYGTRRRRMVKTLIDGKRIDLVDYERTSQLSKKDQLQGIAPNFVHSQDASVNMETILDFMQPSAEGLEDAPPFTTIHDAFGTVAGRMWDLFGTIRGAFVKVHSTNVLESFRLRCVAMLRDYYMATKEGWDYGRSWEEAELAVPMIPAMGDLNIEEVRDADYFFA